VTFILLNKIGLELRASTLNYRERFKNICTAHSPCNGFCPFVSTKKKQIILKKTGHVQRSIVVGKVQRAWPSRNEGPLPKATTWGKLAFGEGPPLGDSPGVRLNPPIDEASTSTIRGLLAGS
jgi:hypothetical protein